MSTWAELRAAGYRRVLGVQIEGIPADFLEADILTTGGARLTASTGRSDVVPALRIGEGESLSHELGRFVGIAAGRALTLGFDLDVCAEYTSTATLFKLPTKKARLTVTVSSAATTTFTVDSTTGWASSGSAYIGREYITYSGTTATTFTGITRAVAGLAHYHDASTVSGYRYVTDTPVYWRGRLVTVFEHLVAPDGSHPSATASATANTVGTYCRELWRGYIDEPPRKESRVMSLRALPVERLLAQTIASARSGTTSFAAPPTVAGSGEALNGLVVGALYITSEDKAYVENLASAADQGQFPRYGTTGVDTLARWARKVHEGAASALSSIVFSNSEVLLDPETSAPTKVRFIFRAEDGGGVREEVDVSEYAWFLANRTQYEARNPIALNLADYAEFDVAPNLAPVSWLLIAIEFDATGTPLAWPANGYLMLESEATEGVEIVRYDSIDTTIDAAGLYVAVRVVERELMGTPRVDPWRDACKVQLLAGASGSIADVLRTIATSSGTGARGSFDTMGFGLGLGLPDSLFDVDRFPLSSTPCDAITDEESSVEDLLGGWLALMGLCLVQRQQAGGTVKIEAVPTTVFASSYETTLTAADVVLDAATAEQLFDAPNVVSIEDSARNKKSTLVMRDVPRQQAEGPRELSFVAPGITPGDAVVYATKLLRIGDGQLVVTLHVAPSVTLRPGDGCILDIGHPLIYDWQDGDTAGAVPARVLAVEDPLDAGPVRMTFLIAGQAEAAKPLCPAARVTARGTAQELTVDDPTGFVAGQAVAVYRRGDEGTAASYQTRTIDTVVGSLITLTSGASLAQFPADGDTWITYDDATAVTADQLEHTFVVSGDEFL